MWPSPEAGVITPVGAGNGAMPGGSPQGSQVGLVAAVVEPPPGTPAYPKSGLQSSVTIPNGSMPPSPVKTGTPLNTENPGYVPD